jgi:hypothetical protein
MGGIVLIKIAANTQIIVRAKLGSQMVWLIRGGQTPTRSTQQPQKSTA